MRSQGVINVSFNAIFKDFAKLGYDCGHSSTSGKAKEIMSTIINEELGPTEQFHQPEKFFDPNQPSTSKIDDEDSQ